MFEFINYTDGKMSIAIEPWGWIEVLESEQVVQIEVDEIETIHYGNPDQFTPSSGMIISVWVKGDAKMYKGGKVVFES